MVFKRLPAVLSRPSSLVFSSRDCACGATDTATTAHPGPTGQRTKTEARQWRESRSPHRLRPRIRCRAVCSGGLCIFLNRLTAIVQTLRLTSPGTSPNGRRPRPGLKKIGLSVPRTAQTATPPVAVTRFDGSSLSLLNGCYHSLRRFFAHGSAS